LEGLQIVGYNHTNQSVVGNRYPAQRPKDVAPTSSAHTRRLMQCLEQQTAELRKIVPIRARLQLKATSNQDNIDDIDEYLLAWCQTAGQRICYLIGEFGSGKTWTLSRLAIKLATIHGDTPEVPLPAFIHLSQLGERRDGDTSSTDSWRGIVEEAKQAGRVVVLVCDGLDELVVQSNAPASTVFKRLKAFMTSGTRLIISCRSHLYRHDPSFIRYAFIDDTELDRTESAIAHALYKPAVVVLSDIHRNAADRFFADGPADAIWCSIKHQPAYTTLTRQPFTLRLLEHALPEMASRRSNPTLTDLYECALEAWIVRDRRISSLRHSPDAIFEQLEAFSGELFKYRWYLEPGKGKPHHQINAKMLGSRRGGLTFDVAEAMISVGLLLSNTHDDISFAHMSIWEFFYARLLYHELTRYDALHLAQTNLVHAYNVNRFLHGYLCRAANMETITPNPVFERIRSALLPLPGSSSMIMRRTVSGQDFQLFMSESKWRSNTGFGVWGSLQGMDGTIPHSTLRDEHVGITAETPIHKASGASITRVSWYDAFVFAHWIGGRLPTLDELRSAKALGLDTSDLYEWTATWSDEKNALIAATVIDGMEEPNTTIGVNPDLRAERISFRVVIENNNMG
jgi:hypothetical protein